jgi:hypothetical protein
MTELEGRQRDYIPREEDKSEIQLQGSGSPY